MANKRILTAVKDNDVFVATSLTKLCKFNSIWSYEYIKSKKFPFEYKGWKFEKHFV